MAGRPFYFRARHGEWTFAVAEQAGVDPASLDEDAGARGLGWWQAGRYGGRTAASFLPPEEAEALIRACAAAYLATHAP